MIWFEMNMSVVVQRYMVGNNRIFTQAMNWVVSRDHEINYRDLLETIRRLDNRTGMKRYFVLVTDPRVRNCGTWSIASKPNVGKIPPQNHKAAHSLLLNWSFTFTWFLRRSCNRFHSSFVSENIYVLRIAEITYYRN